MEMCQQSLYVLITTTYLQKKEKVELRTSMMNKTKLLNFDPCVYIFLIFCAMKQEAHIKDICCILSMMVVSRKIIVSFHICSYMNLVIFLYWVYMCAELCVRRLGKNQVEHNGSSLEHLAQQGEEATQSGLHCDRCQDKNKHIVQLLEMEGEVQLQKS